ncbi:MAG TPA: type II toxin-antitoxin system RelE/ParE family toxin, partial [Bacillota bacterium]
MTTQVRDWLHALRPGDPVTRRLVAEAIDRLLDDGPAPGRPLADRIAGSDLHNLKELRPGSSGASEVRTLFTFDPVRNAVLLVAGDKSGRRGDGTPRPSRRRERHTRHTWRDSGERPAPVLQLHPRGVPRRVRPPRRPPGRGGGPPAAQAPGRRPVPDRHAKE